MKYGKGIFSWYGFRRPIRERFENIKEAGFDTTMLWWGDGLAFDELDKAGLVKAVRESGLAVENIHVPFENINDIWSDDRDVRMARVDSYLEWIGDCADFGIPIMVMHISRGSAVEAPNDNGRRSLERLVAEADRLGVGIALENTHRNDLLEYLLEEFPDDCLGMCYDTSHARLHGDGGFGLLRRYGERLFCLHISDNDGLDDRHWNIGRGVVDWDDFARKFPSGYSGPLSLEVYPCYDEVSEKEFLTEAYRSLTELDRRIESYG